MLMFPMSLRIIRPNAVSFTLIWIKDLAVLPAERFALTLSCRGRSKFKLSRHRELGGVLSAVKEIGLFPDRRAEGGGGNGAPALRYETEAALTLLERCLIGAD